LLDGEYFWMKLMELWQMDEIDNMLYINFDRLFTIFKHSEITIDSDDI